MEILKKKSGQQSYSKINSKKKVNTLIKNLTKEVKDLYNENYKYLKKEIEDTRRWKDLHVRGSAELIL
jgi:predicted transglutaminase-like cysteine proteinase